MASFDVVEICAGAGGQALGLEKAGFEHALAVELDQNACTTLRDNRPSWKVAQGDVASRETWNPADYEGVALLAGGVPCPPFTIAGKQLGATDERDLFAWAIELAGIVRPKAVLLENVRGLSMPRFAGYRQHVLDRLTSLGYVASWQLLHASDYGVPQLRPRFVLVAMGPEDAAYFSWPDPLQRRVTVGEAIGDLMGSNGWEGASSWAAGAQKIAPTIVGGSKKHGGADLGPTRAKRAWAEMGVDALGVADEAPQRGAKFAVGPKLTTEMVARIQGWSDEFDWEFSGRKTSRYRQIGNAFPPPVAAAVGTAIMRAFKHQGVPAQRESIEHDAIYKALRAEDDYVSFSQLVRAVGRPIEAPELERRISLLSRDFNIDVREGKSGPAYKLGKFRAFVGQEDHDRHELFVKHRARIS
ncbi:DNA cytosine methyltransferase [Pseudosporangium ferrugineum]|uniref:DNA (cytosine-5-)-methyltransferase n=1 Tax=Pseudosporangium ferrugineum TaxID=439699 RepID=A0A2T0S6G3_9ACTN|nr:DNA (cytosine-5-)-methyltransferase [Pseudosporangium ferrugineum]PRY29031.1 DNA (cytosine-5)-methyltransferase 1 [Pseudosporangium ferrugineum]